MGNVNRLFRERIGLLENEKLAAGNLAAVLEKMALAQFYTVEDW